MERFREDINRYRFETDTTWTALAEKAGREPGNVHPPQKRVGRHPRSIRAALRIMPTQPHRLHAGTPNGTGTRNSKGASNGRNEKTQHRRQGIHHKGRGHTVRLGLGERSTYQRRGTARRAGPRQHHAMARRMALASRRRGLATDETGRRTHGRIHPARNRTVYRPSTTCCRPSRTGIPTRTPTHGRPWRTPPPPLRTP